MHLQPAFFASIGLRTVESLPLHLAQVLVSILPAPGAVDKIMKRVDVRALKTPWADPRWAASGHQRPGDKPGRMDTEPTDK